MYEDGKVTHMTLAEEARGRSWLLKVIAPIVLFFVVTLIGCQDGVSQAWSFSVYTTRIIGPIPESADVIEYRTGRVYGFLEFEALPSDVDAFLERFCNGYGYSGYDPLAATNTLDPDENANTVLLQGSRQDYYFSYSQDTPDSIFGNRCFQTETGGLTQIKVDRSDSKRHRVWVESISCGQPGSPVRCNGNTIEYAQNEPLVVGNAVSIESRYAYGDKWEIQLTPNRDYLLSVVSEVPSDDSAISVRIIPRDEDPDAPHCYACWVNVRGIRVGERFELRFRSASSTSEIWVFWYDESGKEYTLLVEEA
jgi:hypothetical protein